MIPNVRITIEGEGDASNVFLHVDALRSSLAEQGFDVHRIQVEESKGGEE